MHTSDVHRVIGFRWSEKHVRVWHGDVHLTPLLYVLLFYIFVADFCLHYYSLKVDYQQFRYPSYEDPLIAAYGGIFECAFVLLHPFTDVTEDDYPPQGQHVNQSMRSGVYQTWASVNAGIGFQDNAKLSQLS